MKPTMTREVLLPSLHPGQLEVADHPARFKVLTCGRRWGKTYMGALLCIRKALEGGRAWWVAPTYGVASDAWRDMRALAGQIPGMKIRESERRLSYMNRGSVTVKSADSPDALRGSSLDLVVLDECAQIPEQAWTEALRPALTDREGCAMFIGTPKGHNWFWRLFFNAQGGAPGWAAFTFPTSNNPYIPAGEIEAARADMHERAFAQEYLAQFLDDGGGVFRRVREAATGAPQDPTHSGGYIFGVDWGRSGDFTAVAVYDVYAKALVHLDRFTDTSYPLQIQRLLAMNRRWLPEVIVAEANSIGGPLIEELESRYRLPIVSFTTTQASKATLIDGLSLALENGDITLLDDPVLVSELLAYESQRLQSGALRYGAPSGMHDDTVIALALAVWGAEHEHYEPLDISKFTAW